MPVQRLSRPILTALAVAFVGTCCASSALAQAPAAPMKMPPVSTNYQDAPAGTYKIDTSHASVVARVPHFGTSHNVFRFGDVSGTLTWDPARPEASTLNVTVAVTSIQSPVIDHDGKPTFANRVAKEFLKDDQFATATFESTAFHKLTDSTGTVDGKFTLMGVSQPVTLKVNFVGTGKNLFGKSVLGVYVEGAIDPHAFGVVAMVGSPVDLVIDSEFDKQ